MQQRAASWYVPFFLLDESEEALQANDWQLFRLLTQQNASSEQVAESIARLSQPGKCAAFARPRTARGPHSPIGPPVVCVQCAQSPRDQAEHDDH